MGGDKTMAVPLKKRNKFEFQSQPVQEEKENLSGINEVSEVESLTPVALNLSITTDALVATWHNFMIRYNGRLYGISRGSITLLEGDKYLLYWKKSDPHAVQAYLYQGNGVLPTMDSDYMLISLLEASGGTISVSKAIYTPIVNSDFIQANSILARHVKAGEITADKLSVTDLSAISANLGEITAGKITGIEINGVHLAGSSIMTTSDDTAQGMVSVTTYDNGNGTLNGYIRIRSNNVSRGGPYTSNGLMTMGYNDESVVININNGNSNTDVVDFLKIQWWGSNKLRLTSDGRAFLNEKPISTYLGNLANDPTSGMVHGDYYRNSATGKLKVYDNGSWLPC